VSLVFAQTGERNQHFVERKRYCMSTIQIVAVVLAVVILIALILRRRTKAK
jgi:hypothetical protein